MLWSFRAENTWRVGSLYGKSHTILMARFCSFQILSKKVRDDLPQIVKQKSILGKMYAL